MLTTIPATPITDPAPNATVEADPDSAPSRPSLFAVLSRMFGMDLRSLAVFRIALGLVVLFDVLGRWSYVAVHYSDRGLLSREQVLDGLNIWRWSVYFMNGTSAFAHALFALTVIACLAVIGGYRTRMMTVVLWVLLVSLQVRNPLVLSGADSYLRVLVFWAMFLPLGAVWSVDRWRRADREAPAPWYASVASACLLLQIGFVYLFTALLKTGDEWRSDFTALWFALGAQQLTTPFGSWLHQFPDLLRVLTVVTMVIELGAPVMLFVPWRNAWMRCTGILLIVSLQVGIMLTMNIGVFPWISSLCMICFLPTVVWDAAGRWGAQTRWRRLRTWLTNLGTLGPSTAASPRPVRSGLLTNVVLAVLLVTVLGWNIASVSSYSMPTESRPVMYGLGLYQRWAMFAPRPPRSTQWFVISGTLESGTEVSLLEPLVQDDMSLFLPLSWQRPEYIGGEYYGNKYWRKYFDALNEEDMTEDRRALAGYVCRSWNAEHVGVMKVQQVAMFSVLEGTMPDGVVGEQRRIERATYTCA